MNAGKRPPRRHRGGRPRPSVLGTASRWSSETPKRFQGFAQEAPMRWRAKDDNNRPTRDPIENVLGPSMFVRGDLSAEGAFRIDGTIEGTIASRAEVVIGETGVVRGD